MDTNKLYIKNMVCDRCRMVIENELRALGYHPVSVALGEVVVADSISDADKLSIAKHIEPLGFSLIDDKRSRLISQAKTLIIELVQNNNSNLKVNLSDYLSQQMHHDYGHLSTLFSEVEGTTIERYFIAQKVEKVKELLVYDELSLSEIAYQLNYSSVAHLSSQFKKVTGLTPSHFKQIRSNKRKPLDKV